MLTQLEAREFKRLVFEVYGVQLTDEEAWDQGVRLVKLFEMLLKHKISPWGIEKAGGKVQNDN